MKRSGGIAGRPMGHMTIEQLEAVVSGAAGSVDELQLVYAELGHRKTKRAEELRALVLRLLDTERPQATGGAGALFD
jgi:uncharacterized coiled-coil protein SlyX